VVEGVVFAELTPRPGVLGEHRVGFEFRLPGAHEIQAHSREVGGETADLRLGVRELFEDEILQALGS
jgi:hypothetical protein